MKTYNKLFYIDYLYNECGIKMQKKNNFHNKLE